VFTIVFDRRYSDVNILNKKIHSLEEEAMRKELRLAIKDYEIETLRGDKAKRLPATTDTIGIELISNALFSEIKESHKKSDCVNVKRVFSEIEANFSFLDFYPESIFLMADCYLQTKEYEQALLLYSELIDLYPDHLATGHAILKMVEILRLLDREAQAIEALKVIKRHFSQYPDILKAAEDLATDMGRSL
jgi:tetratricopeptide (TPR) repeat protein